MADTSTIALFAQVATSTGQMIGSVLPLLWLFLGFALGLFGLSLVYKGLVRGTRKAVR